MSPSLSDMLAAETRGSGRPPASWHSRNLARESTYSSVTSSSGRPSSRASSPARFAWCPSRISRSQLASLLRVGGAGRRRRGGGRPAFEGRADRRLVSGWLEAHLEPHPDEILRLLVIAHLLAVDDARTSPARTPFCRPRSFASRTKTIRSAGASPPPPPSAPGLLSGAEWRRTRPSGTLPTLFEITIDSVWKPSGLTPSRSLFCATKWSYAADVTESAAAEDESGEPGAAASSSSSSSDAVVRSAAPPPPAATHCRRPALRGPSHAAGRRRARKLAARRARGGGGVGRAPRGIVHPAPPPPLAPPPPSSTPREAVAAGGSSRRRRRQQEPLGAPAAAAAAASRAARGRSTPPLPAGGGGARGLSLRRRRRRRR